MIYLAFIMEDSPRRFYSEEDLDTFSSRSAIFQDGLNANMSLREVEAFSDWAREEGIIPVRVCDLRELRSHETYGRVASLVLEAAMGRLIRDL